MRRHVFSWYGIDMVWNAQGPEPQNMPTYEKRTKLLFQFITHETEKEGNLPMAAKKV